MKNLAHDLFLLMIQLSDLSTFSRVVEVFLESCNHLYEGVELHLATETERCGEGEIVEISTLSHTFGGICIHYRDESILPEIRAMYRNAVHMLAMIPENLELRDQLTSDKEELVRIVSERTAALKTSENNYQKLIESLNEGVWTIDRNAVTTFVNERMAKMLGYEVDDMIGESLFTFMDERGIEICQDNLERRERGIQEEHEFEFVGKNGKRVYTSIQTAPLYDSEGEYCGSIAGIEDITERKKNDEERKRLELQYRQAQKMEAIGQLAGGVAHDFNNLLMVINGYTDMAISASKKLDSPILAQLEEVRQASERASTLVRQLLTFSRRETMEPRVLNPNDLISGIIKMLRRVIGEHVELEFVPGEDVPFIYGDPGQIEQILMNLCINARDAMPGGGRIVIQTENALLENIIDQNKYYLKKKNYVQISISDNGEGIPNEVIEHIFEPFFTTKGEGKGTGLGLATVYGIVTQHEGVIDVVSDPNRGTTFTIYLPVHIGASEGEFEKQVESNAVRGGRETIFIAEDEESVRNLVVRVLERAGYRTIAACDGEEAIALIDRHIDQIHFAVLDVVMPRKSGKEVADYLIKKDPTIPIVFCSGYDFDLLKSMLQSSDKSIVLHKPFHPTVLLAKIREVLG